MKYLPSEIMELMQHYFSFPGKPLFGQVATIAEDNAPDLRTMRMFDVTENGEMIFLSHTSANKWKHFSYNKSVCLLFLNEENLVQLKARGEVQLFTRQEKKESLQKYWDNLVYDVRQIYDHYDVEGPYSEADNLEPPKEVPEQFGMALVKPQFWESLLLVPNDYPNSERVQYAINTDGQWGSRRINVS